MKKNTGMRLIRLVSSSCLAFLAWVGIAGAEVNFTPTTLDNPASQADARFGYSVAGVGDVNNDGVPDLMIKFGRAAVQDIVSVDDSFSLTLTGSLFDGTPFEATDRIRVISEGKAHVNQGDSSSIQY